MIPGTILFSYFKCMNLEQVAIVVLSGLGVFHGIFVAVLLWKKGAPDRLLSLLMVLLSLRIGKSVVLAFTGNLQTVFSYLGLSLLLLIGPLFFLYCRAVAEKTYRIRKKDGHHFLPGLIFLLAAIPFQLIGFHRQPDWFVVALFFVFYGHLLVYLVKARKSYTSREGNDLSKEAKEWLNILFYGLLSIWGVYVLNLFEEKVPYILGPVLYSATVYCITYLAVVRNYIKKIHTVKYATTRIAEQDIGRMYSDIEKMMQQRQLYLDPRFSLALLSKEMKTPPQKISLVVNTGAGCNFNEYVNGFRIRHAIGMLEGPDASQFTIASISFDCGFNSISTFNHSFKKYTGKTPSAFRSLQTDEK